jgi:Zn ribbon nucleic-acid-binding protein
MNGEQQGRVDFLLRSLEKIAQHDLADCEHEKQAQCTPYLREFAEAARKRGLGMEEHGELRYQATNKCPACKSVILHWGQSDFIEPSRECVYCVRKELEKTREDMHFLYGIIDELRGRLGIVRLPENIPDEKLERFNSIFRGWARRG